MKKLVLSAFACDPTEGSEMAYGWNWAVGLANEGFEVHCFTRGTGKINIEKTSKPDNLIFNYVVLPYGLEKLYTLSNATMYLYYVLWQWVAYKTAKAQKKKYKFDVAHHVTWGSIQMGSFMYKLNIPLVFGPTGGGQTAPTSFKAYFLDYWGIEEKREKISRFMTKYNPACKKMLRNASVVLCSNPDTENMAKAVGAKNVVPVLDVALADDFFPKTPSIKHHTEGQLKLLWVGRFLPRKGLLLLLDVMKELVEYPGITLTVVGDGEMKDVFLEKINEYKLQQTVDWKGKVPYRLVKEFYSTHDIFFFTSLRDSGGVQIVEAMAYCMPIVTINLHGQAIIVDDNTGFRCACNTPEIAISELKKAILRFYQDPNLIGNKSKAAYAFALQQTWKNKIHNIVNSYYPSI